MGWSNVRKGRKGRGRRGRAGRTEQGGVREGMAGWSSIGKGSRG